MILRFVSSYNSYFESFESLVSETLISRHISPFMDGSNDLYGSLTTFPP
jgi:hypothetical protein